MTPRQENSIERSVGRIEAQLEAMAANLQRVDTKLDLADAWRSEVKARLEAMEDHGARMDKFAGAFDALQQSFRDGKMQAKGVMIGIGVAGGAAGATAATGIKWLWAAIAGA
jgi:hypothetical protein